MAHSRHSGSSLRPFVNICAIILGLIDTWAWTFKCRGSTAAALVVPELEILKVNLTSQISLYF